MRFAAACRAYQPAHLPDLAALHRRPPAYQPATCCPFCAIRTAHCLRCGNTRLRYLSPLPQHALLLPYQFYCLPVRLYHSLRLFCMTLPVSTTVPDMPVRAPCTAYLRFVRTFRGSAARAHPITCHFYLLPPRTACYAVAAALDLADVTATVSATTLLPSTTFHCLHIHVLRGAFWFFHFTPAALGYALPSHPTGMPLRLHYR